MLISIALCYVHVYYVAAIHLCASEEKVVVNFGNNEVLTVVFIYAQTFRKSSVRPSVSSSCGRSSCSLDYVSFHLDWLHRHRVSHLFVSSLCHKSQRDPYWRHASWTYNVINDVVVIRGTFEWCLSAASQCEQSVVEYTEHSWYDIVNVRCTRVNYVCCWIAVLW